MFNTKIFENSGSSGSNAMNIPSGSSGQATGTSDNHLNIPQPIDITYQRHPSIFNSRLRRESIAHSQGMGGVSWGSVTIGSWLKDEVMMITSQQQQQQQQQQQLQQQQQSQQANNQNQSSNQQTHFINPRTGSFRYNNNVNMSQSPPANQASYLPDLEADYCKDYLCCGQLLPTLHDLLRHYEDAHISASPPIYNPLLQHQQNRNRQHNINNTMHNIMETVSTNDVFLNNGTQTTNQVNQSNLNIPASHFNIQQQTINQVNPSLGLNNNTIAQNTIPNNFLSQQPHQQLQQLQVQHQQHLSNHQSPHQQSHQQSHQNQQLNQQQHQGNQHLQQQLQQQQSQQHLQAQHLSHQNHQSHLGTPGVDDEDSMYIDDPARHLYVMEHTEHKPYKCPVIGCEKNYKNQNGLKYHRLHGHQNQTLKENPDGTISIIDPESNTPYLDGAGMEKDKPYRCEVCGKRYKNLNGLKYHRGHTTH